MKIQEKYRAEVDLQHVPEDLNRRTLEAMRNARRKSPVRKPRFELFHRPAFAISAVCACLALAVGLGIGLDGRNAAVPFPMINVDSDPRLEISTRAGSDVERSLEIGETALGVKLEKNPAGFALYDAEAQTNDSGAVLIARYEKDLQRMTLTVTAFSSTVYESLSRQQAYVSGGTAVHYGRSTEGRLLAAWQTGNAYCVLETDNMTDDAFRRAAEIEANAMVPVS